MRVIKATGIQDHFDSPMTLLDGDLEVTLAVVGPEEARVDEVAVRQVVWERGPRNGRSLWFELEDGRRLAVRWRRPPKLTRGSASQRLVDT